MTIVSTHDGRGFSKIGVGRGGEALGKENGRLAMIVPLSNGAGEQGGG